MLGQMFGLTGWLCRSTSLVILVNEVSQAGHSRHTGYTGQQGWSCCFNSRVQMDMLLNQLGHASQ